MLILLYCLVFAEDLGRGDRGQECRLGRDPYSDLDRDRWRAKLVGKSIYPFTHAW